MKITQVIILIVGILTITQSFQLNFGRNLQTSIPCIDTIAYIDTFTTSTSPAITGWNPVTGTLYDKPYKYYTGNWSAAANAQLTLTTTGYKTTGNNVYTVVLKASKNTTYTTTATGTKKVFFTAYDSNWGYYAALTFTNTIFSQVVITATNIADSTSSPN